jgi:hypothetical protein
MGFWTTERLNDLLSMKDGMFLETWIGMLWVSLHNGDTYGRYSWNIGTVIGLSDAQAVAILSLLGAMPPSRVLASQPEE